MIALNGLPMPYHPVFKTYGRIAKASDNNIFPWWGIERPANFDAARTHSFLSGPGPRMICGGAELAMTVRAFLIPKRALPAPAGAGRHHRRMPYQHAHTTLLPDDDGDKALFSVALRRLPVGGTVARGDLHEDAYFYTGKIGSTREGSAVSVTLKFLTAGRRRFNINCTPCHGRVGDGGRIYSNRGFKRPPRTTSKGACASSDRYFFDVMTTDTE